MLGITLLHCYAILQTWPNNFLHVIDADFRYEHPVRQPGPVHPRQPNFIPLKASSDQRVLRRRPITAGTSGVTLL
jgi:hypothetical protein